MVGPDKKEKRLRYLRQYWTSRVKDIPGILLNTPLEDQRSCAIANVGIKGMNPGDMAKKLLSDHKIFTVAINNKNVIGCRITPNLYTTEGELDIFIAALKKMAASS